MRGTFAAVACALLIPSLSARGQDAYPQLDPSSDRTARLLSVQAGYALWLSSELHADTASHRAPMFTHRFYRQRLDRRRADLIYQLVDTSVGYRTAIRDDGSMLLETERRFHFVSTTGPAITTHAYSTLGLKTGAELMLWWKSANAVHVQDALASLLSTGLGRYCEIAHSLWGLTRPSLYTKRRTTQEQAVDEPTRLRYLIVYPFTKTIEWYLMSRDARQGMMNEHMRIGHDFDDVRQVLLYTTGLDDQEFIVAYETDSLERHQDLVIALRSTKSISCMRQ